MKYLIVVFTLLIAFLPSSAAAQEVDQKDEDWLIRINGNLRIEADETVDSVVVIGGDVLIEGTVRHNVLVIDGDAFVSGTVGRNVTSIEGDVILLAPAVVHNVRTISGDLERANGATVTGRIRDQASLSIGGFGFFLFTAYLWAAATFGLIIGGLIFAAIGGRQLTRAALAMTGEAVNTIVGAVILWVGVPILTLVIMFTLVGIPLGMLILTFFLPTLFALGYITAGARLGGAILGRFGREPGNRPLAATALGVLILQIAFVVPLLGWLVALIAGIWGGGALAFTAFRAAGGKSFQDTPSPAAA